jgi:hypothetical protein
MLCGLLGTRAISLAQRVMTVQMELRSHGSRSPGFYTLNVIYVFSYLARFGSFVGSRRGGSSSSLICSKSILVSVVFVIWPSIRIDSSLVLPLPPHKALCFTGVLRPPYVRSSIWPLDLVRLREFRLLEADTLPMVRR